MTIKVNWVLIVSTTPSQTPERAWRKRRSELHEFRFPLQVVLFEKRTEALHEVAVDVLARLLFSRQQGFVDDVADLRPEGRLHPFDQRRVHQAVQRRSGQRLGAGDSALVRDQIGRANV